MTSLAEKKGFIWFDGKMVNSSFLNGQGTDVAKENMIVYIIVYIDLKNQLNLSINQF